MLLDNYKNHPHGKQLEPQKSMAEAIIRGFRWIETPQKLSFWSAIFDHFSSGFGVKTYDDFKHLDKSVK